MEVIRGMWNGHEVLFCFQEIISECKRLESSMINFEEDCFSTLPAVCRMNSKNMDHLHSLRVVKEYQYIKMIHVNQVQILLRHREFSLISAHLFPLTSGEKHPNVDLGSVLTQLLEAKWPVFQRLFIIPVIHLPKPEKTTSQMQTASNELLSTDCWTIWTVRLSVEQQRSEWKFRFGNWKERNSSGALTMPNMQIVGNVWLMWGISNDPFEECRWAVLGCLYNENLRNLDALWS